MGILSWLGGPGGWIGDAVKSAFTGPLIQGVVDYQKNKLAAGNTAERIEADLAARELAVELRERELAVQQNIADEGRWWTAAPRAIACWSFAIFIVKCVVWDKVLGLGSTDPLSGDLSIWAGWLMALWFGGRSAEKIARIIKR
ncbi:hypothetical protein XI06_17010 [Bradyrhizobium sp. CCBAU 11434]|uniref:hypothetical protein n=1 Tax=Bradyrhizobium sp. CCBAU 11434 TaxID=1630885 RepID=UPI0023054730|nr:hypothetical protein [Bradyrhizobium sp. CCBAU 11434]MDA9521960.1 hypothetical protein [Bradyrhizobium sp. CCBAU 11434]